MMMVRVAAEPQNLREVQAEALARDRALVNVQKDFKPPPTLPEKTTNSSHQDEAATPPVSVASLSFAVNLAVPAPTLRASTASPNVVALERARMNGINVSMTVRCPSSAR